MSDHTPVSRRTFLAASAAASGAALCGGARATTPRAGCTAGPGHRAPGKDTKAVKLGMVGGDAPLQAKFTLLTRLGFDGVELDSPNGFDAKEVLAARDATGLEIHGVIDSVHWKQPLSHPDPKVRAAGIAALETALHDAKTYGASTVLLVPAVVNKEIGYAAAWDRAQAEIRRVLPLAARLGVRIAIENVWNNFLLSPLEAARFLDDLDSPYIGAYLDCGNVVRFGWPEQWAEVLGPRVLKVDVKGYSRKLQNEKGPSGGLRRRDPRRRRRLAHGAQGAAIGRLLRLVHRRGERRR